MEGYDLPIAVFIRNQMDFLFSFFYKNAHLFRLKMYGCNHASYYQGFSYSGAFAYRYEYNYRV
jgi:hypothetical protein